MDTKILNCPFCGNNGEIREFATGHKGGGEFTVSYKCGCEKCKIYFNSESLFTLECSLPKFKKNGYEECIKMWNHRVQINQNPLSAPPKENRMELFPIMAQYGNINTTEYIPFDVIASHEQQALKNHSQTLEKLSERGGLSYCETLAVLEDRAWNMVEQNEAKQKVIKHIEVIDPLHALGGCYCRECKHLKFSDCYGECGKGYMGIVRLTDFCSRGERRTE